MANRWKARVVGGVSCVEAIVGFEFYFEGDVRIPSRLDPRRAISGLEDARFCAST